MCDLYVATITCPFVHHSAWHRFCTNSFSFFLVLFLFFFFFFFFLFSKKKQGVVDGDLCEQYWNLDFVKQKEIASELFSKDPHPSEVLKKLEDFQESILFVPPSPPGSR